MNSRRLTVGFVALAVLAGSLYAATMSSAAGAQAESTVVRRTVNCKTNPAPGDVFVQIHVSGKTVSIATGDLSSPEKLLSFTSNDNGYKVGSRCHSVTKRVVMSLNRLTSSSHASAIDCSSPAHVLIRLVLTLDSDGSPAKATIEITQPHRPLKPLAQVQWSVGHVLTYYGVACDVRKS